MKKLFLFAIVFMFLMSACGYHQISTNQSLPQHIRTIAIPTFQNPSLHFKVEQRFTHAVVDEFLRRGRSITIVPTAENADALLTGTIKSFQLRNAVLDQTGRNRVFEVRIISGVTLRDLKTNKVIFDNQRIEFHGEYELSDDPVSFFNEDSPAVDRIAREFAQSLVSTLLLGLG
jgi:hypothetical protein